MIEIFALVLTLSAGEVHEVHRFPTMEACQAEANKMQALGANGWSCIQRPDNSPKEYHLGCIG